METLEKEREDRALTIIETLPKRVATLSKIIESDLFTMKAEDVVQDFSDILEGPSPDPQVAKRRRLNGAGADEASAAIDEERRNAPVIPSNPIVMKVMDIVKREARDAVDSLAALKLWMQLLVPKVEDGNNFGVQVQEECSAEVERVENIAFQVSETMTKYFIVRGRCK